MANLEFVNESLKKLSTFLEPALPLLNCNMNDFYTSNLWETFIPDKLHQDIEMATDKLGLLIDYLKLSGTDWSSDEPEPVFVSEPLPFHELGLEELVFRIRQLSLVNMNVCAALDELNFPHTDDWEGIKNRCQLGKRKFDSLMPAKKEHEVKTMTQFVAGLVKYITVESENILQDSANSSSLSEELSNLCLDSPKQQRINSLVDLGSGKGYLSCFLTLLYKFDVLAIDSSSVNTEGSKKYTANVYRIWKNVRNAVLRKGQIESSSTVKCLVTAPQVGQTTSDQTSTSPTSDLANIPEILPISDPKGRLRHVRQFVTDKIDLDTGIYKNFVETKTTATEVHKNAIDESITIVSATQEEKTKTFSKNLVQYGILGLHTCGALGSTSLRLFRNSSCAKFLVNVPCCHHLLEEGEYLVEGIETSESSHKRDFPLSKVLLDQKYILGHAARMLSSHSPHRMVSPGDPSREVEWETPMSNHYRSLLQVILKRQLGNTNLKNRLGKKVGLMGVNFRVYTRGALVKLQLEDVIALTDADIDAVENEFEGMKEYFFCFYLLRSMFAPLLDACVILDRLAFLLEQGTVGEAYIVRLFDPAVSPRCHALVAIKK